MRGAHDPSVHICTQRAETVVFPVPSGTIGSEIGNKWQLQSVYVSWEWETEEKHMPVLLLWAVPAIIVVGGTGYYLLRAVH